jgi:hypothetical protein
MSLSFHTYELAERRAELQRLALEAHYRKEEVCEPSCIHSPSEPLCSRHSSRTFDPLTTGRRPQTWEGPSDVPPTLT